MSAHLTTSTGYTFKQEEERLASDTQSTLLTIKDSFKQRGWAAVLYGRDSEGARAASTSCGVTPLLRSSCPSLLQSLVHRPPTGSSTPRVTGVPLGPLCVTYLSVCVLVHQLSWLGSLWPGQDVDTEVS